MALIHLQVISQLDPWQLAACVLAALLVLGWIATWRRLHILGAERAVLVQENDVVLRFVHEVAEAFATDETAKGGELLDRILNSARRAVRGTGAAAYLYHEEGQELRLRAMSGVFPPLTAGAEEHLEGAFSKVRHVEDILRKQVIPSGVGILGHVARTGETLIITDPAADDRVPHFAEEFLKVSSIMLAPMRFRQVVIGVLATVRRAPSAAFVETDVQMLQLLADHAAVTVHFSQVNADLEEKRSFRADLQAARKIQRALLPAKIPSFPGVELAAFTFPAKEVGGDYYDFIRIDEDHVGVAVADVSGKGIPGAMLMSVCRSVLRTRAPACTSAAAVLKALNAVMGGDVSEDMFVSVLYMVLNLRTRELTLARAGHTRPIVMPRRGEPWQVDSRGMAVGMADAETFDSLIEETTIQLNVGDLVVCYTDGVTEAMDRNDSEWGVLNLVKTVQLASMQGQGAADVAQNVQENLLQFVGDVPQYDDMTLVSIRLLSDG